MRVNNGVFLTSLNGFRINRWCSAGAASRRSRLTEIPPDASERGDTLAGRSNQKMLVRAVLLAPVVAAWLGSMGFHEFS
jgi:hypothetical protein